MVYMLLGTGFEETEAIAPLDLLRRAGVEIATVGITGKIVYGSHGIGVEADILPGEMDLANMEMIILPGGLGGVASARASRAVSCATLSRARASPLWRTTPAGTARRPMLSRLPLR